MKPTLLVLAAGMGSRYGGLKQIDPIGPSGETIIDYSIYDAIAAKFGKIVFVIRESFKEEFVSIFDAKLKGKIEVDYVCQEISNVPAGSTYNLDREKPWGTGHAILMAKESINTPFAVINADDYYGVEAFATISDFLIKSISDKEYSMVAYNLCNTISENGSVSRGVCKANTDGMLETVVERCQIEKKSDSIAYFENEEWITLEDETTVSMNFWGFTPAVFTQLEEQFIAFLAKEGQELKSEFFIPSVVAQIISTTNTEVKVLKSDAQWFGVTYRADKEKAINAIAKLVSKGVYPAELWK